MNPVNVAGFFFFFNRPFRGFPMLCSVCQKEFVASRPTQIVCAACCNLSHLLTVPDYYPNCDQDDDKPLGQCYMCGDVYYQDVPCSCHLVDLGEPNICRVCGEHTPTVNSFCESCKNSLPQDDTSCVFCDSRVCHSFGLLDGSAVNICDRCEGTFLRMAQSAKDCCKCGYPPELCHCGAPPVTIDDDCGF